MPALTAVMRLSTINPTGTRPQPHPDHFAHADRRIGDASTKPNAEKIEKNDARTNAMTAHDGDADKIKRFHSAADSIGAETTRKVLISWKCLGPRHAVAKRRRLNALANRARLCRRIPVPSAKIICYLLQRSRSTRRSLVRESVSFLLALRRAYR